MEPGTGETAPEPQAADAGPVDLEGGEDGEPGEPAEALVYGPRGIEQRHADVLEKLQTEVDLWVASASADGRAYLVPLSFAWDGTRLIIATPRASLTARNLERAGWARVGLGPTRDVAIIEGPIEIIPAEGNDELAAVHAAGSGFDVRGLGEGWAFLCLTPQSIQAWREANELEGRHVMAGGQWLG